MDVEEEEYATQYIYYYSSGVLPRLSLPKGKSLRVCLAEELRCDPMRITKKFAGASCLGNQNHAWQFQARPRFSQQDVEWARRDLARLERRFRLRLALGEGAMLPPDEGQDASLPSEVQAPLSQANSNAIQGALSQQQLNVQQLLTNQALAAFQVGTAGAQLPTVHLPSPLAQPLVRNASESPAATAVATAIATPNMTAATTRAAMAAPSYDANVETLLRNAQLASACHLEPQTPQMQPRPVPGMQTAPQAQAPVASQVANSQLVLSLQQQIIGELKALASLSPAALAQVQLQMTIAASGSPLPVASAPESITPAPAVLQPTMNAAEAAVLVSIELAAARQQALLTGPQMQSLTGGLRVPPAAPGNGVILGVPSVPPSYGQVAGCQGAQAQFHQSPQFEHARGVHAAVGGANVSEILEILHRTQGGTSTENPMSSGLAVGFVPAVRGPATKRRRQDPLVHDDAAASLRFGPSAAASSAASAAECGGSSSSSVSSLSSQEDRLRGAEEELPTRCRGSVPLRKRFRSQ